MTPKIKQSSPTGIERIAAERARQIAKEGWDADHDDAHYDFELAYAAICYASPERIYIRADDERNDCITFLDPWPGTWLEDWDKRAYRTNKKTDEKTLLRASRMPRKNYIRQLEKAGALLAAEIDRLLRLEKKRRKK